MKHTDRHQIRLPARIPAGGIRHRKNPVGRSRSLLGFGLVLSIALGSCTEPPPVSLSAEDRAQIDTIYAERVQVLRTQLDSQCEARFEASVQRAVDSMLPIRRAEEERLRQRMQEEASRLQ